PGQRGWHPPSEIDYCLGLRILDTLLAGWQSPSVHARAPGRFALDLGGSSRRYRFTARAQRPERPSFRVLWRLEHGWPLLLVCQKRFRTQVYQKRFWAQRRHLGRAGVAGFPTPIPVGTVPTDDWSHVSWSSCNRS